VDMWRTWLHFGMQALIIGWQLTRFLNFLLAGEGELDSKPALGGK